MSTAEPISELLLQWEEAREQGQDLSAEELCRTCPEHLDEVRRRLEALRAAYQMLPSTPPANATINDAPAELSPTDWPQLPGYEILAELGQGGMGVVYKATQLRPHRLVALKMLLAGVHAQPEELVRFMAEADMVAQLQHPHIVQLFEFGQHAKQLYCTLEYVEGVDLAKQLQGTPQPAKATAQLLETLARAIHFAHQRGIVHRDLKPANILLTMEGVPKITDFGLARRVEAGPGLTQSGAILGTPSYMAPEQAEGKSRAIGPVTDIFALGAILYEALTGRPPFKGASVLETLEQVRFQEPVPPSRLLRAVPRDLETICLKCLQKDPRKRYASAEALAEDLRRFREGMPILARPVGSGERLWRWCRRNPVVASMTAMILLLTLVGIGGIFWQWQKAEHARQEAEDARGDATAKAEAERQTRQDRERLLTDTYTYSGLVAGARDDPRQALLWFAYAARLAGDDRERADANRTRIAAWGRQTMQPVRAFVHPAEWIEDIVYHPGSRYLLTRGFDPASGETDCLLWDPEREAALPFPGNPDGVSTAAWDAPGERLAIGTRHGEVTIYRFPSGELLQRLPHAGRIAHLLFSPDGRYCALAAANRVRVWDCRQVAFATPELEHPAPITTLALHPQGELLATACRDHSCRVFAVPSEKGTALYAPVRHYQEVRNMYRLMGVKPVPPLFVDEGCGLLTLSGKGVSWCDPRTGRVLRVLPFGESAENDVCAITLSADGKYMVLAGTSNMRTAGRGQVQIYDVASAQPVGPPLEHQVQHYVLSAAFSPDGQTLLTGSSDRTARLWSVSGGKPLGGSLPHPTSVSCVALAPDGRHLATAQRGGLIRQWALPAGNPSNYHVAMGANSFVRLSRDGRFLLPTGRSLLSLRSTQVFDLTSQRVGPPLKADGFILDAAFSPDGLQVAAAVSRAASSAERFTRQGQQLGHLLLWDWRAGKLQHEPLQLPSEPRKVDYSSDGRQLAVVCARGELVMIDPTTGKTLRQWQAHPPHLNVDSYINNGAVRFAPDNRNLLTYATNTNSVRVWDALTGQLRHELKHQGRSEEVQFSPDGQLVATTARDNLVCVWDLATGEQLASLPHPDWTFTALFSPDGAHLLTACRDGMVRLWDWRTGRLVCPPFTHEHEVHAVAFHPNGRWVLTGCDDGTLRVWEWRTGKPVTPPLATGGAVLSLAVTPDGNYAVVGGFMDNLKVFYLGDLSAPNELSADDLCTWSELVSGQRVHEGGGVTNLTAEEWLQRWRDFRRRHPVYPPLSGNQRLE